MRRLLVLFAVLALVAAACGGGSSDDGDDGGDQSTTPTAADGNDGGNDDGGNDDGDSQSTPPPNDDSGGSEGEGPSTGTVTINGETYEFSTEGATVAQCLPDLFGTMAVGIPLADGADGLLNIVALHEGTDPAVVEINNSVHVDIGDTTWVADPEDVRIAGNPDYEGLSQVDSVEVNGNTVTGTATFRQHFQLQ